MRHALQSMLEKMELVREKLVALLKSPIETSLAYVRDMLSMFILNLAGRLLTLNSSRVPSFLYSTVYPPFYIYSFSLTVVTV